MMVDEIKLALRISKSTKDLDTEILALENACIVDMKLTGVVNVDLGNALIRQAIKTYCKAHFGNDPNSEKYKQSYEKMRDTLALAGDINV
jgi:hypothetical protein